MAGTFRFKAALTLLSTEESGRRTGVFVGYRPDWVFDGCELGYCMGQLVRLEHESLARGETQQVELRVTRRDRPEILAAYMRAGQKFSAMEGPKRVATGQILEVLETTIESDE